MNKKEFIEKVMKKHNQNYNFDLVPEFINSKDKIKIICPIHGEFEKRCDNFIFGQGCPKCSSNKLTLETFIEKANKVHDNFYDYSLIKEFINSKDKVKIICPIHGEFQQRIDIHLFGQGCPECGLIKQTQNIKYDKLKFESKANKVHNNFYDYSNVEYIDSRTPVKIICPIHGEFQQIPANHLNGIGCPECKGEKISEKLSLTTEEFIKRARLIHTETNQWGNPRYEYHKVNYKNMITKIWIHCTQEDENGLVHGDFQQIPAAHLSGQGCPICAQRENKKEQELKDYIKSLGFDFIENDRKILNGKELDIYIPDKKIALEFNGKRHHSTATLKINDSDSEETKKLKKQKFMEKPFKKSSECENQGIRLIHVWEHLWDNPLKQKILKNIINSALGIINKKIFARKCISEFIDLKTCSKELKQEIINFFDNNNINGYRKQGVQYCTILRYNNEIVHAFTWGHCFQNRTVQYELIRGASKLGYNIIGGSSKLWKLFFQKIKPESVLYYVDYNFFNGKSIEHLNPKPKYISKCESLWNYDEIMEEFYNRKPMKHKEILENKNIIQIPNAGTKTYIWRNE